MHAIAAVRVRMCTCGLLWRLPVILALGRLIEHRRALGRLPAGRFRLCIRSCGLLSGSLLCFVVADCDGVLPGWLRSPDRDIILIFLPTAAGSILQCMLRV